MAQRFLLPDALNPPSLSVYLKRGLTKLFSRFRLTRSLRCPEHGPAARIAVLLLAGWTGALIAQTDTAPRFPKDAGIPDLLFQQGVTIADIVLPKAEGGNVDLAINGGELSDYSFDPARLPPCLEFNRYTRVLSGTPTVTAGKTAYTFWAHDDDDNFAVSDADTLRFDLEILKAPAPEATARRGEAPGLSGEAAGTPSIGFAASFATEWQWFQAKHAPELPGQKRWRANAWRGERIQRHVLVSGAGGSTVQASDFSSQAGDVISARAVTARYPQFVIGDIEARDCEGYPTREKFVHLSDALPLHPSTELPPGYPVMLWISVDIPEDANPGMYHGNLTILSAGGAQTGLAIELEVSPWRLPAAERRRFHLDLWQFPVSVLDRYNDVNPDQPIQLWSEAHYRLLEPFYRYLADLGQRVVTAYIKDEAFAAPSMIRWVALDNGKRWTYDYSVFDAHVQRLAGWGIDGQISAFSPVGWNKDEIPFWDAASQQRRVFRAPPGSQTYNALWNDFLTDFKAHLKEKGWFEKTVLYMDEVPEEEMEAAIALIRYNDPNWKIGLAYGHAPNKRIVGSLYDVSGYYETEPEVEIYEGQLTTFYTSCSNKRPNSFVAADANPADMAAIPWYAIARSRDGYLRWAFDNWKSCYPLDLREGQFTAGDFSFVYRSGNDANMTVVPSVRSELLRDGIEDYEKVQILMEEISRCGREDLHEALQAAARIFTREALAAGRAPELLKKARSALAEVSRSISPGACE